MLTTQLCGARATGKRACCCLQHPLLCADVGSRDMPLSELACIRLWPAHVAGVQCQDSFPV